MASTSCKSEAIVETETPWIDAWVRWERNSKQLDSDESDSDEHDDTPPAVASDTFSFRYPLAPQSIETNKDKKPFVTIELRGFPSESEQIWNSTGLTLWRSSHYLCEYLIQHPELIQHKQVVELGSGLGRCGILAHHMGARHVCLTDGDTDTLAQLRKNVKQNKRNNTAISCRQLLWGQDTALEFVKSHGPQEIVMGSDLVYVSSVIEPLFETARTLLNETGVFIMAHCHRRQGSSVTVEMVLDASKQAGFQHEVVQEENDISVLEFRQEENRPW